jgi:hypothetical protein
MQVCNCTVAIGGDAGMTITKERVTVPELMVLRAVHGEDAVRNISVIGKSDVSSPEERERLISIYIAPAGIVKDTVGAAGSLPKTLDESGIPEDFIIDSGAKKSKKASATEALDVQAE